MVAHSHVIDLRQVRILFGVSVSRILDGRGIRADACTVERERGKTVGAVAHGALEAAAIVIIDQGVINPFQ